MKCILCESHIKHTFEHPTLKTIFHQCETCGVIFKDASYFPSLDMEKARYEEHCRRRPGRDSRAPQTSQKPRISKI